MIFRNQPNRNKNCLWQPCLLTDRDEISNLYRGPSIDASYQVSFHLVKWFQRRRFLEIGSENDQTYIFRFVRYLSTFFYTYLPVNIHFQLIIITNFSILTDPAYFVPPPCHCGILALRSRDFWEITLREKHVFGLFTWKTWKCWMRVHLNWITIEENNIYGWYL
jgi:hypothetical protein